ncbi:hypothetical protein GUJ93_ZPchr0009g999 [Zizania palustris]|uniref:Uncharacterized protein n=1 Tax=Zizania palustris TaxID=103762 RepID=A0A8J5RG39_ZIZPA|nr:hypothetical protein GUJ93_ZPchr0009g999 [Zizania palustris]
MDDAALTTNKRAMEQGALIALSPVAEAKAQRGGRKGDAATGQTLAKLLLPPPRVTSTPNTCPVMRKSKQRRDLGPNEGPNLAGDATHTDFPSHT